MDMLQGEVEQIIYRNETNGYTVCCIRCNDCTVTVIGSLFNVSVGETIKVGGSWTKHPSYGEQFKADFFERELPKTEDAMVKFLGSGIIKGMREATAKKIIKKFGEESLDVLKNQPERLSELKGISLAKALEIGQAFADYGQLWEVLIFLQKFGVTPTFSNRIYACYGGDTIERIKDNPYRLVDEIPGIGFKTADRIAMHIGIDPVSAERAKACIKYVLLKSAVESGHTFLPEEKLVESVFSFLGTDEAIVKEALEFLSRNGDIALEIDEKGIKVFLKILHNAESNIAKKIVDLSSVDFDETYKVVERYLAEIEKEEGFVLVEEQRTAVIESIINGVIVITGGPGTGKTTIVKTIVKIFEKMKMSYALAAPTGRAAKRLSEATGKETKTIHRLLEIGGKGEGAETLLSMKRNTAVILEDAVVIDEASMVDIILMNQLLEAIPRGTRLIIVGDADQLPAVGPGNVLKDLISSSALKVVKLKEIFRQASESMIVVNAHRINSGCYPEYNNTGGDFFLVRSGEEEKILQNIISVCAERLKKVKGYDFFKDIQVLSPTKKGVLGIKNLNISLQKVLNPNSKNKNEKSYSEIVFREGDKVMQTKNNYDLAWRKADDSGEYGFGIFNGDIGIISEIDNSQGIITVAYDERLVEYSPDILDELELAYAVTVHKSQGSEFPVVVMPVYKGTHLLTNRNLLYTAVTRAKEMVVLVGKEESIKYMVDNCFHARRYSALSGKITQNMLL
ncbi:MAG: ATP-dependent RecD-like DNA helicase [Deltaproteobacteria bacterium]